MTGDTDYVYDEESGEWMPASELAARKAAAGQIEARDAVGNILQDGDQVVLVKDLEVKGAGKTLKVGTVIKAIRRKSTAGTRRSRVLSCVRSSCASVEPPPPAARLCGPTRPDGGRRSWSIRTGRTKLCRGRTSSRCRGHA